MAQTLNPTTTPEDNSLLENKTKPLHFSVKRIFLIGSITLNVLFVLLLFLCYIRIQHLQKLVDQAAQATNYENLEAATNSTLPLNTISPEATTSKPLTNESLIGIWQDNDGMAAGWADHYSFFTSGNFHFYASEMVCHLNDPVEQSGTWQLINDHQLQLTINKELYYHGSGVADSTKPCDPVSNPDQNIKKEIVSVNPPKVVTLTTSPISTLINDTYTSLVLDQTRFWQFSIDPSNYSYDNFSETITMSSN